MAESAYFQKELTRMEAILAASEIYSRLAVTQQFLGSVKNISALAKEDITDAEALSRKGLALGADFYTARAYQSRLEQLYNEIAAQHAALSMAFNVLRGTDPSLSVEVALDFKKPLQTQGTAQDWIAKATQGRLDVKVLNKMLEAQKAQQGAEKKSSLPKVVAFGTADDHQHGIGDDGRATYMVGVAAKMDIFDPTYHSRVKIAQEEINRLTAQMQDLKDQTAKSTAETFYRLSALGANAFLADSIYSDSEQAVRLMQTLYKEGRANIFQMISSRVSQVEAYERWLKLEAERRQSLLTLKFYAGELTLQDAEAIYGE